MRRALTVPALLLALTGPAAAQTTPGALDSTAQTVALALSDGTQVLDRRGNEIAEVRYRVTGADGAVRQVLVRTGGMAGVRASLKALPAATLTPKGNAVVAPLTHTELQALPDAEPPAEPTVATPPAP